MTRLIVLRAMVTKSILQVRRYPFNLISGLITLMAVFLVVFFGAKYLMAGSPSAAIAGSPVTSMGDKQAGIVLALMLWAFTLFAYSDVTWHLMQEATQGTLEQLYMSPVGFGWVALSDAAGSLIINFTLSFSMLFLMMLISGQWLHMDLVSVVPLMLLVVWAVYGIGLLIGGMALVFKQVQAAFQIMQFFWLGLIVVPIDKMPLLKYAPVAWGRHLLQRVMLHDESITRMPPGDLMFLVLNSAVYFGLGYLGFKWFERVARDRGLLGHY